MDIPQRSSLVPQLVEILRRALRAGKWTEQLPGEHNLCNQLQVSRPILRKALAILAQERHLRAEHGSGWKILTVPRLRGEPVSPPRIIILCFVPPDEISHFNLFVLDRLQDRLHQAGCQVEIHAGSQYASQNHRRSLQKLLNEARASHWLLVGPPLEVQQWFLDRKLLVFITLTSYQSISLPSLRMNEHAIYHHAVGMLVAKGHRRIAWLAPRRLSEGKEDLTRGFWEGVELFRKKPGISARVTLHSGTVASIRASLDSLFKSPSPPTGLLVSRPNHVMAAVTHLIYRDIRVPRDVSVVCIGYEPFLENMTPSIAHYAIDRQAYARKLCRMVLQWVATGRGSLEGGSVTAHFHEGESLGRRNL
ncbi:MAG: substrate-binding domain-containing protein [Verrucomicrobia bacterium]|nr:substrate-binding domain-containing protein [Verrucomicrobiota bacterium]